MNLRDLLERPETRAGRTFDLVVQGLIIASLVTFSIETLPGLSPMTRRVLDITEVGIVVLFTLEYVARLLVARRKLGFVLSFFGLVDLAAILPFYLQLGVDLRSVRFVRVLRLFRLVKLLRYGKAIGRLQRAFLLAKEEIIMFFAAAIVLLYISAVGIYYFERVAQPEAFGSVFHGLWWAVATLTTVGYGDVAPHTVGGRIFTFVILMIGLGIVAVPTGLLASALSEVRKRERE